jgi:hypothetical protein
MPNQVLGAAASGVNPVVISSNASVSVPVLMYRDQRVITTELLARGYGTDEANIRKNLSRNAGRFEEGTHIFTVEGDELRDLRVTNSHAQISSKARSLTLWTEKGERAEHPKYKNLLEGWLARSNQEET